MDATHDESHVVTYSYETPDGRQLVTTFPREPVWWRDAEAESRRRAAFQDYNPADLCMLVDDIEQLVSDPLVSEQEVARLVRRQWSLSWISDVASGALRHNPPADILENMIWYWQVRAGRFLANQAWRRVMELPATLVDAGVRTALACPTETDLADDPE